MRPITHPGGSTEGELACLSLSHKTACANESPVLFKDLHHHCEEQLLMPFSLQKEVDPSFLILSGESCCVILAGNVRVFTRRA